MRRAALLVVALLLAGCGGDDGEAGADRPRRDRPREPPVVSTTRTIAGLESIVVRPERPGRHPLVVFVHGAGSHPFFYADYLRSLAAGGYVVVAPTMPSSANSSLGAFTTLPLQPGLVRDIINGLTTLPSPVAARVDPERIAVAGHSLGGMTALGIGYHDCCADDRVDGVISIAGEMATFPGGAYRNLGPPLLLIHGNRDGTVDYAGSREALTRLTRPAWLLTVRRGDHGAYLNGEAPTFRPVVDASIAFLDAALGEAPGAGLARLDAVGRSRGVRLEQA
jgi:dienelactone hydrolase